MQLLSAAFGLDTVRACFSGSAARAEPSENVVPLTNYPGLAPGSAAELRGTQPPEIDAFLVDAWKVALIEQVQQTLPCKTASALGASVNKTPLTVPATSPAGPTLLAITGCPNNAAGATMELCGAAAGSTLALDTIALTRTIRGDRAGDLVVLSRTLKAVSAGFGPLGACPTSAKPLPAWRGKLALDGFAPPSHDWDTTGLVLCDNMGRVAHEWSWTAMQMAAVPSSTPEEHYGRKGLFAFAIVGEEVADPRYAPRALAMVYQITQ